MIPKCTYMFFITLISLVCLQLPSFADDIINGASLVAINPQITPRTEKEHKKSSPKGLRGWLLAPVVRLQEEVVRLEKHIADLRASVDGLHPGTVELTDHMSGIQGQTAVLLDQMIRAENDMKALQNELKTIRAPIVTLTDPVRRLHSPIEKLYDPLTSVDNHVIALDTRFSALDLRFGKLDKRFVALDSRFGELDKHFVALDSRFKELGGRFTALDSRFTTLDVRFAALGNQLVELQNVLWVIAAILVAAIIIGAGTVLMISFNALATNKDVPNASQMPAGTVNHSF